ncbi:unnamed protein product [Moneuplotes crassus]|uniref:Coiled-coil domain-containing protein 86 n=1 Tax=Euplotes crassus TaxID=5936 RepID=A0AAD1XTT8_EUPCR|nr:unnamed protein product [Moneuplotes crassus]
MVKKLQKNEDEAMSIQPEEGKETPEIGKPKSGKPWKKLGTKLDAGHNGVSKSWKRKEKERQRRKALIEKVREVKAKNGERLKRIREKKQEKEGRRKYNEMKSGSYQIIRNTTKLKKWNKKAKRLLTKLPAELYYEKFGKSTF